MPKPAVAMTEFGKIHANSNALFSPGLRALALSLEIDPNLNRAVFALRPGSKGSAMAEKNVRLRQGEYTIQTDPELRVVTLLGSCVACCFWDEASNVGGMNHMLLAHRGTNATQSALASVNAMEVLINGLIQNGARRDRLKAKVFGGANMQAGGAGIGGANGQFVLDFLNCEKIECVSRSLGGGRARQVVFWPATGRARMKYIDVVDQKFETPHVARFHGVELF